MAWDRGVPTSRRIQIYLVFRTLPSETAAEREDRLQEFIVAHARIISRRPCLQGTGVETTFSNTADQMEQLGTPASSGPPSFPSATI